MRVPKKPNNSLSLYKELKDLHVYEAVMQLREISGLRATISFFASWLIILAATVTLYLRMYYLFPFALILVGSQQRALSNLVHDASHFNLFKNQRYNDFISNMLAALPMGDTIRYYRQIHRKHHRYLGHRLKDPDLQTHLSYGFDDYSINSQNPWTDAMKLLVNKSAWKDSFCGSFLKLNYKEQITVVFWWAILLSVASQFECGSQFILIWVAAKVSTYHVIRVISEFLDHSGLPPGPAINYTRNLADAGLLTFLTHPHSDNYHLAHHLFPKVPHYRLKSAHRILNAIPIYKKIHQCDGYLIGKHSAWICWSGNCRPANT